MAEKCETITPLTVKMEFKKKSKVFNFASLNPNITILGEKLWPVAWNKKNTSVIWYKEKKSINTYKKPKNQNVKNKKMCLFLMSPSIILPKN